MKFVEIKNKNDQELDELLQGLKTEKLSMQFKARSKELKTVHQIKSTKKKIAQILTIKQQRSVLPVGKKEVASDK
jgi:ribosomal protein L29